MINKKIINKKVAREATQNATKMYAIPSEAYAKRGYRAPIAASIKF
jgi:hypothetical protein